MFQANFQGPLFTAYYSGGSRSLENWSVQVRLIHPIEWEIVNWAHCEIIIKLKPEQVYDNF